MNSSDGSQELLPLHTKEWGGNEKLRRRKKKKEESDIRQHDKELL